MKPWKLGRLRGSPQENDAKNKTENVGLMECRWEQGMCCMRTCICLYVQTTLGVLTKQGWLCISVCTFGLVKSGSKREVPLGGREPIRWILLIRCLKLESENGAFHLTPFASASENQWELVKRHGVNAGYLWIQNICNILRYVTCVTLFIKMH